MFSTFFKALLFVSTLFMILVLALYGPEIKVRITQFRALNDIETAFQKQKPKDAEALLLDSVNRWPQEAMFRLRLAHYFHHTHQWTNAKIQYEAGLKLYPTARDYQYNYARLLIQLRETNAAIQLYRQVLNESPHHLGALLDLGGVYRFAGNRADAMGFTQERYALWDWARYYYSLALEQDPHLIKAWYGLSDVLQRDTQFKAASAGYCQVIHHQAAYPLAWFNLGLSQWYDGDEATGLALMNWAIQSQKRLHQEHLMEESHIMHALRQTYYLVHKKQLPLIHFDEHVLNKVNDPHPEKPLTAEDFPPALNQACQGWVAPTLNTQRPRLKVVSSHRLNTALNASHAKPSS